MEFFSKYFFQDAFLFFDQFTCRCSTNNKRCTDPAKHGHLLSENKYGAQHRHHRLNISEHSNGMHRQLSEIV